MNEWPKGVGQPAFADMTEAELLAVMHAAYTGQDSSLSNGPSAANELQRRGALTASTKDA